VTNNDDGTHVTYGWDVQNTGSWSDYAVTTDSQNRATTQTTHYDDGTYTVAKWDVQNAFNLSCEPDCDRIACFLQRTRVMRFPDTIDVEVFPSPGGSTIAIYSRSLIGRRDFGVNRARVARRLAAVE
jgi:hypothetical protein